ncbi:MAG: peptidylprolyl isomerase [Candidatus Omnitrophica bacterium]|nr:peptidylprolyl isomerase [Candidatus Omnitrophota bacterium]
MSFILIPAGQIWAQVLEAESITVGQGKKVKFDYTLTVGGEKVDSSQKQGPLVYTHGQGQIIPGLEKQLEGMRVGEKKQVKVTPEDAYGQINPAAFKEISKEQLPTDVPLEAGQVLSMKTPNGNVLPVVISEVRETTVILDLNHPLAGKELDFDVAIVSIE